MPFKPLNRTSQTALLLEHFRHKDSISHVEAQALYRIRALARRIMDLKERHGLRFEPERRVDPTGQRYVRYVVLPPHPEPLSIPV